MRPADKHLTPQELDLLLLNPADSRDSNASGALSPEARQHLNGCALCQSAVEKYRKAEEVLRSLRAGSQASDGGKTLAPGPECPSEDTWSTLAAGLMDDEKASSSITHAATCNLCGPRLKKAMQDLSPDITAEEEEALARLPVSSGLEHEIASRLAAQAQAENARVSKRAPASANADPSTRQPEKILPLRPQPVPQPSVVVRYGFQWWPNAAWAAAVIAVAAVSWVVWITTRQPDVNKLLAQAYTQPRTIELRMPGADYAPLQVERGNNTDLPAEFYRAQDIIRTQLARHPEDPAWLQAQARAHMLEWEYDKAIRELDHALALKPDDPGLLLDEAIALAQRAEKTGPFDLGQALDNLNKVLQKSPENKVALFNRAIILDKMQSPGPAITDLDHYLALDQSGPWADEARRRLTELRKKNKTHQQRMEEPLLEPRELVRKVTLDDESTWTVVDARVEDYLDRATEDWLSAAFSSKSEPASRQETLRALQLLAMILQRKHADQWLADMLQTPASDTWSQALSALREAILDNRSGDLAGARVAALRASRFFSAVGSNAGRARADAELVYVLHRLSDAKNCLRSATQLAAEIRGKRYAWLDSYLLLEQGVGFELTAQSQRTQQVLAAATRQTGSNGYGTLHLRAVGMEASFKMTEGDIVEGWSRDMRGLSQYQDGVFPPLRAYQFYADLAIAAETQGYWHLAYSLRKEAAEANALTGDHARGFIAYFAVAQAARIAGLDREADDALLKTSAELKLIPSNSTTQMYQAYNQLELAKLDGQIRQAAGGLALLDQIEPRVKQSGSFPLLLDFYSTQGNLWLELNQRQAAKNAFQLAVHAAGAELATLDDPRDRLTWQKRTDDLYRTFIELQLDEGNAEDALALLEWHRGAVFKNVQPRLPLAPEEPASLTSFSDTGKIENRRPPVIVYAVFPQQFVIFLCNNGKIIWKVLPVPSAQLRRVVQQFYAQCSDHLSDMAELRKNSRQLYDWLIAPIQPYLGNNQSLMIEPDDILKQVPFRALLNSDQNYLGDSYLLHLIPAIAYLDHIRKPGVITPRTKALFVGVSASIAVQGHHLPALPSAEKEVRNLGAKFLHPRILSGKDAEVPAIEQELAEAELFHFAGHALTTQDKVTLLVASAIENELGYLDSTRLRQLQLDRLQLVVLSGCSTGLELDRRLPQLDRMVETLLEKGVPIVVASLWDVDTLATKNTMESFYENMADGKPVPDSLKESARLIRSDLQTTHPYYWAGFEIFGSSH